MTITVYTREEVAKHHTTQSLWIIVHSNVYDITEFQHGHPGGEEILLQYGGKDVTDAMEDPNEHLHSGNAYEMLEDYLIGTIDAHEVNKKKSVSFIDINEPMLYQVWTSGWSKSFYLEQVHTARHAKFTPRVFASPILEIFSKNPWWVVPMFWLPIITYCAQDSANVLGLEGLLLCFPIGLFIWTFIEYSLHRFLFHVDDLLPDNRVAMTLHFLLHGIHHFLPMDRLN